MEVDGVKKEDYWKVVDQCYLCDLCFMTKCPYVPPHEWNVDFPHLMLRAKAIKFRKGEVRFRDKLLSSTDALGKLATIPVVVQTVNAINRNGPARRVMDSVLGIHKDRVLPEYSPARFRAHARPRDDFPVKDGQRTPGKVAIYATCYVNYNEPGIGHDLLKILEHNEIPVRLVEKEACCGMLCHPHRRAFLHADVQAGAAPHVPGRCRRQGGAGSDVRPLRISGAAPAR